MGSVVLALIVGALLPIVALIQISLLAPTLMLGGIVAAHLGAKAGWIPVGALTVAAAVSAGLLMGGRIALVLIVASLAPSAMVVFGATGKKPFFEQMNAGVIAFVGGLLAAMLIARRSSSSASAAGDLLSPSRKLFICRVIRATMALSVLSGCST